MSLPLVFLSSAFAPLDSMPAWLAAIAWFNPMTHAVDSARSLVVGGATASRLLTMVLALVLFNALTIALAHRSARRHLA